MWTWNIFINNKIRNDINLYPVVPLPYLNFFDLKYHVYLHKPQNCSLLDVPNKSYYNIPLLDYQHCDFQKQIDSLNRVAILVYNVTNITEKIYVNSPLYVVDNSLEYYSHVTDDIALSNSGFYLALLAPFIILFIFFAIHFSSRAYKHMKLVKSYNFKKVADKSLLDPASRCTICQESLNDNTIETRCKHYFHAKCISKWCKESETCPNCKQNLVHDQLTPLVSS